MVETGRSIAVMLVTVRYYYHVDVRAFGLCPLPDSVSVFLKFTLTMTSIILALSYMRCDLGSRTLMFVSIFRNPQPPLHLLFYTKGLRDLSEWPSNLEYEVMKTAAERSESLNIRTCIWHIHP